MAVNKNLRRNTDKSKKVKNPDNAPVSIVNYSIETRPIQRTTQDIPKWRKAIQNAEAHTPRRKLLTELYHDVVLDAHVIAVTGKRQDAVTGADWKFVNKDGEAVDFINDIIDSIGFENLVKEILNSKFWGYTMLEPKFYKAHNENWEMDANLIPRRHYFPEKGVVSYDGISDDGINVREGIYAKTILEAGETTDLGLFASAAQYYVLKRGGIGDYAMYVQTFGNPILDATWDGVDEQQRQKLSAALKIGAGGTIIRPDGTELTIIESKGTQASVHEDFKNAMNTEISKALLGSTETTESSKSSGFAQSETHSNADDKKFTGDVTFVRKTLNSRFIKLLESAGFDTEGGKFIVQKEDAETKAQKVAILVTAKEKFNLPMNDDDIYEATGIPKPDDYDAQKKAQKEVETDPLEPDKSPGKNPTKKTDKKPDKPKSKKDENEEEAEVKLFSKFQSWVKNDSFLKDFFLKAPAQVGATIGKVHTINLSFEDTLNNDAFLQRIYDAKGKLEFDSTFFNHTLKTLLKGFKKGWDKEFVKLDGGVGFEYNFNDPAMLTAFELNLFRFAGAKDLALVQKLNAIFRDSTSFKDFYAKASAVTKVFNQNYLETEYNTALLTGESASLYQRLKAQTDIFPYWQYVTANDEHVRHSHQPLHNLVLPAEDERWQKLFPPNGWNCRCYVKPLMKDQFTGNFDKERVKADAYLKSPAFAKEQAQGWGVNRGEIGEIFTANQQYINTFQDNSSSILNELSAVKWGLPQYSNAKKIATANAPVTIDEDLIVEELKDYNSRIITLKKYLIVGTSEKAQLVTSMLATVKNPHEVWVQNNDAVKSFVYLHYFKDKTIAVRAILEDLELTIADWADIDANKDLIKQFRKGLLALQ